MKRKQSTKSKLELNRETMYYLNARQLSARELWQARGQGLITGCGSCLTSNAFVPQADMCRD